MIKTNVAKRIGATILETKQQTLQGDGVTQLAVIGEVYLTLSHNHVDL